jgi:hypothetical protein
MVSLHAWNIYQCLTCGQYTKLLLCRNGNYEAIPPLHNRVSAEFLGQKLLAEDLKLEASG